MKPLIVKCPCCHTELDIDRDSGQIVRTGPRAGQAAEDRFSEALTMVKQRQQKTASAFDAVQDDLRGRERKLDDVFSDAFRKVKEQGGADRPFNPLDED